MELTQPMSHWNNCLDNTHIELIFGHFKDDVDFKKAASLAEVKEPVDEYMGYYNGTRKAMEFKKDDATSTIPKSFNRSLATGDNFYKLSIKWDPVYFFYFTSLHLPFSRSYS